MRWLAFAGLLAPGVALAHVGQGDIGGGLRAGLAHPILGVDHVIAMVAVGIGCAQLGVPAISVAPGQFLLKDVGLDPHLMEVFVVLVAVITGLGRLTGPPTPMDCLYAALQANAKGLLGREAAVNLLVEQQS